MARQLNNYTLTVSSRRATGETVTRRYANLVANVDDEQARAVQHVVNSFDDDQPNYLRLTRVDDVDTEPEG